MSVQGPEALITALARISTGGSFEPESVSTTCTPSMRPWASCRSPETRAQVNTAAPWALASMTVSKVSRASSVAQS